MNRRIARKIAEGPGRPRWRYRRCHYSDAQVDEAHRILNRDWRRGLRWMIQTARPRNHTPFYDSLIYKDSP